MSAYIKRTERSQINDLMLHLKLIEKHSFTNMLKMQQKQHGTGTKTDIKTSGTE
jgi:uncharacterized protein YqiB (DUF1249 family)